MPKKRQILEDLQQQMNKPNFWDNKQNADAVISELTKTKGTIDQVDKLIMDLKNDQELLQLLELESDDGVRKQIEKQIQTYEKSLESLEIMLLLGGKYDSYNCTLEIHSGAGGTEACDWAMMLYRMYLRFCESHHYKVEVLDYQPGEEVGIKSATIAINGNYAYGKLKCEKGIHRLVRLSPFDSGARRHTSFASVDIIPEIEENSDIVINEKDLKIDVYRSSGAGGQHVNTTDSAVRITHLPTKTVVTCQNGRSQIQNKEKAMQVLRNKLKLLQIEQSSEQIDRLRGEQKEINFGSQIRSYVMHPYSLVKDHRTNVETSNVIKVLDGDIDLFINSNLRREKNEA